MEITCHQKLVIIIPMVAQPRAVTSFTSSVLNHIVHTIYPLIVQFDFFDCGIIAKGPFLRDDFFK